MSIKLLRNYDNNNGELETPEVIDLAIDDYELEYLDNSSLCVSRRPGQEEVVCLYGVEIFEIYYNRRRLDVVARGFQQREDGLFSRQELQIVAKDVAPGHGWRFAADVLPGHEDAVLAYGMHDSGTAQSVAWFRVGRDGVQRWYGPTKKILLDLDVICWHPLPSLPDGV